MIDGIVCVLAIIIVVGVFVTFYKMFSADTNRYKAFMEQAKKNGYVSMFGEEKNE